MRSLLLDSHVFLWAIVGSRELDNSVSRLIATTPNVYVSTLSLFELKIKEAAGKLRLSEDPIQLAKQHSIQVLDLTPTQLKDYKIYHAKNPDPFDNALLAIAEIQRFHFLTADEKIVALQGSLSWIIKA